MKEKRYVILPFQYVHIMKVLVTGASGFIGSHIVAEALQRGYDTWAAVRPTSSRRHLHDTRIRIIELDYADDRRLVSQLRDARDSHGQWDVVIHCAGATQCIHRDDFYTINYEYTRRLADALIALEMVPRQFIFISTLGTFGPIREAQPFLPISDTDSPQPNTVYGRSKRMAEEYLMSLPAFPYVIFRPTGVYGLRDKDYQILIDSIRRHVDLTLGSGKQRITFIYIADLVKAIFLAVDKEVVHRCYFVTDGKVYGAHDFGYTVQQALGIRRVCRLTVPLWVAQGAAWVCDGISCITKRSFTFNGDKYRILKQRNWTCDIGPLMRELGYQPEYNLQRGIKDLLNNTLLPFSK